MDFATIPCKNIGPLLTSYNVLQGHYSRSRAQCSCHCATYKCSIFLMKVKSILLQRYFRSSSYLWQERGRSQVHRSHVDQLSAANWLRGIVPLAARTRIGVSGKQDIVTDPAYTSFALVQARREHLFV